MSLWPGHFEGHPSDLDILRDILRDILLDLQTTVNWPTETAKDKGHGSQHLLTGPLSSFPGGTLNDRGQITEDSAKNARGKGGARLVCWDLCLCWSGEYPCQNNVLWLVIGIFIYLCMYLFIFGCVGPSLLHGLFSSCGERGLLSVAVGRLLIAVASLAVEHGL